jgi:hypothetical protein
MHDVNTHLTDEQLSTHLDNRVDAPEQHAVNSHLQTCPECSRALDELSYTVRALRELPVPPLPRSFQIVEAPRRSLWSRLFGSTVALQGFAAAAAGLFVILLSADMVNLTSPAGIVPLAPAAQPTAAAPRQVVQATTLPYSPSAPAGRASDAAPAPPAPAAAPAAAVQAAPTTAAAVARQSDTISQKQASETAESARLESLTARNGTTAAAGPVPRFSVATVAAGFVAVVLIVAAVARTLRRA